MISQKQLDANRRNALKSTGPKTPQGKAAVRLNAWKHGLHAQEFVLSPEEQVQFDRTLDAFLEDLHPDVPEGTALVRQIAETSCRIALLRAYETQLLNEYLRKLTPSLKKKYRSLTPRQRLAAAFQSRRRWTPAFRPPFSPGGPTSNALSTARSMSSRACKTRPLGPPWNSAITNPFRTRGHLASC